MSGPRVVAFGGGHGLAASLSALRLVTDHLTAVVTVADDGGSSGRLRSDLGSLPPGDLRMALASLAGTDPVSQEWAGVVQHRFGGTGPLAGHAVGNLLFAALAERLGDTVAALDRLGQLLGTAGRVLPLATTPLDIVADVVGLPGSAPGEIAEVRGQVAVATTPGRVVGVRLEPAAPPACPVAVRAVRDADWAIVGPGSWFTSVIPHVLVPDMAAALTTSSARRLLAVNLAPQAGETEGFSAVTHLDVLAAHAPDLRVDVVLADSDAVGGEHRALAAAAAALGARLELAPVAVGDGTARHDPQRLAAAYGRILRTGERNG